MTMMKIERTTSENADFIALVAQLDNDLALRDGDEHAFYHQFNGISELNHVVVLYTGKKAVGCGAIKIFQKKVMEIKRMYVLPEARGKGLASKILKELEKWTSELGFNVCVLETGKRQPEAIALYKKNNYIRIANYGQYKDVENSICFRKKLVF